MINILDKQVIGFQREEDHKWLLSDRQGFLYFRDGEAVGYGYVGEISSGPIAMLDDRDIPHVLAHAESYAFQSGYSHFGIQVSLINRQAVETLLPLGYHLHPFLALVMQDNPHVNFENYIMTSPVIFL